MSVASDRYEVAAKARDCSSKALEDPEKWLAKASDLIARSDK